MQPRLDMYKAAPGAYRAMAALEAYVCKSSRLEQPLQGLVRLRASQINGCAFCIDMHTKDARAAGETEQRLYRLDAWREAPFYTDHERAAFAWTEAIARMGEGHAPDDVFQGAR